MRKTKNPQAGDVLLDRMWDMVQAQEGERAPGLHISDLTNCLRKSWARQVGLVPESARPERHTMLLFLVGKLFHAIAELRAGEYHPHVDGIHGSVDRMDTVALFEGEDGSVTYIPGEVKTTRARVKYGPSESYINQLASYCYMTSQTKGRLYILHIIEPEFACWDVEFERDELVGWWAELMRRKEVLEEAVTIYNDAVNSPHVFHADLLAPPISEHTTWECKFCPIKQAIGCPGGTGSWVSPFVDISAFEES